MRHTRTMPNLRRLTAARGLVPAALVLAFAACAVEENGEEPGDVEMDTIQMGEMEAETRPPPVERQPEAVPTVPEGTSMAFRVTETVSTGTHRVGDTFTAQLSEAALAADGSVALAAGTPSTWVVTRSRTEGEAADSSLLAFRLQSLEVNGTSVIPAVTVTGTDIEADEGDTTTESVAKVAVGAAAGAIIGQILGRDTESTLKGAGAGAAVGAVVALTTGDGEARLAEGSTITVRLDEALRVR